MEIIDVESFDELIAEKSDNASGFGADLFMRKFLLPAIVIFALLFIVFGMAIKVSAATSTSASVPKNTAAMPTASFVAAIPTATPIPTMPASTAALTPEPTAVTAKAIIVVDAGHGGFDPGTQGTDSGTKEDVINLAIAKELEVLLQAANYQVVMTRTSDGALADSKEADMCRREEILNGCNADMFISIHQNAFPDDRSVRGPEVYYHTSSPEGKMLASAIQQSMDSMLEIVRPRGTRPYDHRLTKYLPYSVLVECGYLTNAEEESLLISASYQKKVAEAIFAGIESFFADMQ